MNSQSEHISKVVKEIYLPLKKGRVGENQIT
ncbi:MAG: hypothetical protein RLZZ546_1330 [Bacteroidota bacterium]